MQRNKQTPGRVLVLLSIVWNLIGSRRQLLLAGFGLLIVNRALGAVLPASTRILIDEVVAKHHLNLLGPLVGGVVLAAAFQGLTSFAMTNLLGKESQRVITRLRCKVQAHMSRLPLNYYDSNKTGALAARVMTDVEGVRNLIGTGLVEFVGSTLTASIALFFMVRISPLITGVAGGCLVLFAVILKQAFRNIRPMYRERNRINAEVTGRLIESLGGVRVVKAYQAEEREASVFTAGAQRLLQNILRILSATSVMNLSTTFIIGSVGGVIMFIGARQIAAGNLTVGGLFSYTVFMGLLVTPIVQVTNIGIQMSEALAGLERAQEVLHESREDQAPGRTVALPEVRGWLKFEHVDFAYEPGKPVLKDVSFEAPPGTVTALVGSSGSGKSTITGLVAAFYKPTNGRVTIDGVDLSSVKLSSYRCRLGVVLQESFLFDGTILENIAFSRPDATESEIHNACRIAHVDEFAERFPDKYHTVIGERGVKLSGGQRQRVSIARAVLADPKILILDEATSNLDSKSEALIQQGLKYLMKGRTTFVIAHRLSTIRQADQILVIEEGKVIERGTHLGLHDQKRRYFDLYTQQYGTEAESFMMADDGQAPDMQAIDAENECATNGIARR